MLEDFKLTGKKKLEAKSEKCRCKWAIEKPAMDIFGEFISKSPGGKHHKFI